VLSWGSPDVGDESTELPAYSFAILRAVDN
jgi:hypothetical protein